MAQQTISLDVGVDLIIDEPYNVSSSNRAAIITATVLNEFTSNSVSVLPANKRGEFEFKVDGNIFTVFYQYKAKRVVNGLAAYSSAIRYIKSNPHLFDQRLADKAIEVLRKCYNDELR